ncbi:MAG: gamma-glutamyl-gamma-aminobutyrate hydrolase family protein [Planctomycetia bacterium]
MRPLIGITTSTHVCSDQGPQGLKRFALPAYYVARVEEAGGLPLLLPNAAAGEADAYVARLDGLLLSGGVDVDPQAYGAEPHPRLGEVDPARDAFELALVRAAREARRPIFAICRGMQLANVAFGGTLVQDIPSEVPGAFRHSQSTTDMEATSHRVALEPGTGLSRLAGADEVRVNSFHHQSVARVAPGFRVTARAGDGVIEAMEHVEGPFFQCVQWHPERLVRDTLTGTLFSTFIEAARTRA